MNRLRFLIFSLALLALHAPFLVTHAGRKEGSSSRKPLLTTTEVFETEYASVIEAIEKGTSKHSIHHTIKDLENRPIAREVAQLRHTWPDEKLHMLGFLTRFTDFQQHLPICKNNPLEHHHLEKFRNLFTWNPDNNVFTIKLKGEKIKVSLVINFEPNMAAPTTLFELENDLKIILEYLFVDYLGGAGRSQLEKYLVEFVRRIYSIGVYENIFHVEWYKLLRMHLDARSMKDYGKDREARQRGENFYHAIDKVVAWIRFGRNLRDEASQRSEVENIEKFC